MDIRDYVRVARNGWRVLVAGLLLGAGLAAGISLLLPPRYTATTQLFVSTTGAPDLAQAVQGNQYAEQKVASYAQLLRSKELATAVLDDLGLRLTPDQLMARIDASVVPDTTILDVAVTDPSPDLALAIARSVDAEFTSLVRRLETPEGATFSPVRVNVVATPELPRSPSFPAVLPNTALGAVLGLLLAGIGAVIRDRLDTTVKDDAVAADTAHAAVIGHIPHDANLSSGHVIEPHSVSPAAEAVRQIRTNLAFLDVDSPPRCIMVTSSVAGEGKTTLAVNLAVALAESGSRVTLVDADLRRPKVTRYLGLISGVGLTNVLTGRAELDEVTQDMAGGHLQVLGSGPLPPNPSELVSSTAMADLVRRLRDTRDIVVIDAPPVLPVADATAMAGLVDGVLLCGRWGTVTTEQLGRSSAGLSRLGAKVLGLVLTVVPARAAAVAYGYGYEPDPTHAQAAPSHRPSVLGRLLRRRSGPALPTVEAPTVRPRATAASARS